MVCLRQFPQRRRLLRIQRPDGHLHVLPACGGRSCPDNVHTSAEVLPVSPPTNAARAWPPWGSRPSQFSCLTAHSWSVHCKSWERSDYSCGEKCLWTGKVVSLAKLLGRQGNPSRIPSTPIQAAAKCNIHDASSAACYRRQQKTNSFLPSFRHKDFRESPWVDDCSKPAWVDAQLVTLNERMDHSPFVAPPWSLSSDNADKLMGPGFVQPPTPQSVRQLCQQGQVNEAVEMLELLVGTNCSIDKYLFYSVLKECVVNKDLMLGGQVHALALKTGFGSDTFLCNHFIRMYAGNGKLQEAMEVFRGVAQPDAFMWSSIISAHVKQGQAKQAIEIYQHMRASEIKPNGYVLVAALQACAAAGDLLSGKQVHNDVLTSALEHDNMFVCSCLVDMYAKCGSLKDSRRVFDGLAERDVVTWNSMIAGYARVEGMGQEAFNLYGAMLSEGVVAPDAVTFVCLLQACANVGVPALEKGKQLHLQLKDQRLDFDVAVGGSLVNMYVKCGSLRDARVVFDGLTEKNVVTWNAMIAGYAQQEGKGQEALRLYNGMRSEGIAVPDAVTFVCLLQACASVGLSALDKGKQLHSQLKGHRLESDIVVGGSLVNMYLKCGSLEAARSIFDGLGEKNVVTWNAIIAGYAQQEGMGQEALRLYSDMHSEGKAAPDSVTFVYLLQACANVGASALEKGKQLHSQLKDLSLESDVAVGGSLVNMYVKCGSLKDARVVFDGLLEKKVVTWNAMIAGYAQQEGMGREAISLYSAMNKEGIAAPTAVTFVCLLQACANVGVSAIETGRQLHVQVKGQELESDVVVGGSLVNMYSKCGSLEDARRVFDGLSEKDVVTWTAMIAGYAQQESMGQEALKIYSAMRNEGRATPDAVTYVCLLEACANVGALQQGKQLHSDIREGGFESNVLIGTALVRLYAKCGCLDVAREVFDKLPIKDVVTCSALLKGYAEHGEAGMAIQYFEALLEQGMQPDEVTYTSLFTACSHAGLVDQGQLYFETMLERHGVEPNDKLYGCMVDLLGRSGHLDKAEQMLQASGLAGNAVSWRSLLFACKTYGDAETAKRCFDHLVKLEPTMASAYVLLSSIYANAGKWDEVKKVERLRKVVGARKVPGKACIEVKKKVHEFTVGEERSDVGATLSKMNTRVKEGGHVPQTQLVLRAMSEQEKEDALCGHAEKLALAYGLLNTPAGATLMVSKNLRMCNDCHSSTKIMSRLEKRDIVVRDGHKVHRFQNGVCSCQDRP